MSECGSAAVLTILRITLPRGAVREKQIERQSIAFRHEHQVAAV